MIINFVVNWRKLHTAPSSIALVFQNGLESHNADMKRLHDDDPSTSGRNLVSLRPATPQFTRPDCIQQSSIGTLGAVLRSRSGYTLSFAAHFSVSILLLILKMKIY